MTIRVVCANGHALAVEDQFAGRTGRCPKCRVEVYVPAQRQQLDDDDILEMVGPATLPASVPRIPRPGHSLAEDEPESESAASSPSDSPRRMRVCKHCQAEVPETYHVCPHCRTYFTLRSIEEVSSLSGRETQVCRRCGARSFPGENICRTCGAKLLKS